MLKGCAALSQLMAAGGMTVARSLGLTYVMKQSAVPVALTGSTSEVALATITLPQNSTGPNGRVRITPVWEAGANNANSKRGRVRFGGIGGTIYSNFELSSVLSARVQVEVANRGAANSQVGWVAATNTFGLGSSGSTCIVSAVDTSAGPVDIVLSGQLALGTDTLTLQSYLVELMYGA